MKPDLMASPIENTKTELPVYRLACIAFRFIAILRRDSGLPGICVGRPCAMVLSKPAGLYID